MERSPRFLEVVVVLYAIVTFQQNYVYPKVGNVYNDIEFFYLE